MPAGDDAPTITDTDRMTEPLRGRYDLLRTVGSGGHGEVFEAWDRLHGRKVAVKRRWIEDPAALDGILAEGRALLGLRPHAGLVTAREDFVEPSAYVIVMDWVDGRSLDHRIPMDFDAALDVLAQVAAALDHLHGQPDPVVHGDVKPSNIVVDADGHAVLVDFGLASRTVDHHLGRPAHTKPYVAPEVAVGEAPTPASDRYSFAVTAYELICGTIPEPGARPDLRHVPVSERTWVRWALERGLHTDPDKRPGTAAGFVAAMARRQRRTNLPAPRSALIGRSAELTAIERALLRSRIVTLIGIGGVGKSRLALEAGRRLLDRYPDGCFEIDLSRAGAGEPADVMATIAEVLGLVPAGRGSSADQTEVLLEHLSVRALLLLFDGCEGRDGVAATADAILSRSPHTSILATSREPLGVSAEQRIAIGPLPVEPNGDETPAAQALFWQRAQAARHDIADGGHDADEICRRLDGLPLALELAAARAGELSIPEIAAGLREGLGILAPDGDGGLRAVLEWSFDSLDPATGEVLAALTVFPSSFSASDAAAVATCDDGILRRLVERSLVVADLSGAEGSYRLLETVRTFASARLRDAGKEARIRDRHRDHMLRWVTSRASVPSLFGLDGALITRLPDLRAALAWSREQGREDLVVAIASCMGSIWFGQPDEGRRWLGADVAEHAERLAPDERVRSLTVAALTSLASFEIDDGGTAARAVDAYRVVTERGEILTDTTWASLAHSLLALRRVIEIGYASAHASRSDIEALLARARDLATTPELRSWERASAAEVYVILDDHTAAAASFEEAIRVDADRNLFTVAEYASLSHVMGDHDRAMGLATRAFDRSRDLLGADLWGWTLYVCLPYVLELGLRGRFDTCIRVLDELLDELGTAKIAATRGALALCLGAVAALRGEDVTSAEILSCYGSTVLGRSLQQTPSDLALHRHYAARLRDRLDPDDGRAAWARGRALSLDEAIALGMSTLRA